MKRYGRIPFRTFYFITLRQNIKSCVCYAQPPTGCVRPRKSRRNNDTFPENPSILFYLPSYSYHRLKSKAQVDNASFDWVYAPTQHAHDPWGSVEAYCRGWECSFDHIRSTYGLYPLSHTDTANRCDPCASAWRSYRRTAQLSSARSIPICRQLPPFRTPYAFDIDRLHL